VDATRVPCLDFDITVFYGSGVKEGHLLRQHHIDRVLYLRDLIAKVAALTVGQSRENPDGRYARYFPELDHPARGLAINSSCIDRRSNPAVNRHPELASRALPSLALQFVEPK
jgi:hypothetical protein